MQIVNYQLSLFNYKYPSHLMRHIRAGFAFEDDAGGFEGF